ncbi:MAG: hypothetical protein WD097_01245 [Balneolales bacterium]
MEEREQIQKLAEQVLKGDDLFLVEVELKGSAGNRVIWVYIESDKGNISLDRCAEFSRELNLLLEAGGWHDHQYTLNVSSPGLDRPLKDLRQYVNNVGRKASVVYVKDGEEFQEEGELIHAHADSITLLTSTKEQLKIPFSNVMEARIQASFK